MNTISIRDAYGAALAACGKSDDRVVVLDLSLIHI